MLRRRSVIQYLGIRRLKVRCDVDARDLDDSIRIEKEREREREGKKEKGKNTKPLPAWLLSTTFSSTNASVASSWVCKRIAAFWVFVSSAAAVGVRTHA